MTILCTGSVAFDYLMSFPGYFRDHIIPEKLETISLSFLVDSMVRQRGGVAPNIAYNLALLGEKPRLLATVGEDFEEYRVWLEEHGVDTKYVKVIPGKYTASFFANTDKSNAQIASFYTGAMANAAELRIRDANIKDISLVVISPNSPEAMAEYPVECQKLKIPYLYDPSQQIVRMDKETLRKGVEGADSLFCNEYEFELLQNATEMKANDILKKVRFMVITQGKDGALVFAEGKKYVIPVFPPSQILDPTGVGDAFRGGFLSGLTLNLDWQTCGQMGSLAATYCLERRGTQNHTYTREEFIERYRTQFDDQGALDALLKR
ncbi:carbohydrate kinase family protein [Leptolinea tardivitalis]|uniref:Ribokinase n=1 Tax=Leptolinea tardivitalis TaxID=229920 RepID=A0A0P6WYT4_9CHLR|nr:carbohydrate kinase family protein [Leptolinea tardivitalis]KPL71824.1 ribokinase [Leptolinea tardivitalis]GAP20210.1 sugar kinases, ribokinase family [Leptolinea tardivitalis]